MVGEYPRYNRVEPTLECGNRKRLVTRASKYFAIDNYIKYWLKCFYRVFRGARREDT